MLNIQPIPNTAAAKSYYKGRDYWAAGQEMATFWNGKAAERLGLSGEVQMDDFFALCDNLHPRTGQQLTAKTVENRRVGYDFTFSAPKSVSVAWAIGGDPRIAEAFREAVNETMAEMERMMEARVRKGGANHNRNVGNMVWADYLHPEGRPVDGQPDPQLHIHAVALNVVWDHEEKVWKAGDFAEIKANAPYFHAAYQARLANKLQDLGYSIRQTKDAFEIEGVPDRVLKEFSRRTKQIEERAADLGITRPETKAKLGATTRQPKTKGLTWGELLEVWKERVSERELMAIEATKAKATQPLTIEHTHSAALDYALEHLLYRKSVATEREVVTTALQHGLGSVTVEGIWKELGRPGLIRRDGLITTQEVLNEEKRVQEFAHRGRGRYRPLGKRNAKLPETLTPGKDEPPTPSQAKAIRHIWESPDRAMLVYGGAGVGKTKMLKAALAEITAPYAVLAPSVEAGRGVLRREGLAGANTLAKFLNDRDMQEAVRGGLIVLDEASMAPIKDASRLCELANQLNARVLFLGDQKQHKSPLRGDLLAVLEKAGLITVEVSDIQRQKGEYKAAVKLLKDGRSGEAFDKLNEMNWVKVGNHTSLVNEFLDGIKADKSVLIVSPTHKEGDAINALVRDRLKEEGRISTDEHELPRLVNLQWTPAEVKAAKQRKEEGVVFTRFGAYRPDKIGISKGDRIRTTAFGKDADGKEVDNGSQFTVTGFTDDGIRVMNEHSKLERILPNDFSHLTHAYVETSFGAQGKTVDRVIIAMGEQSLPAVDMATAYVSVSRGRERATVYTDAPAELRAYWNRERPRMLATELVKKPRRSLMKRLKKHVAFLIQRATLPTHTLEQERGMIHAR